MWQHVGCENGAPLPALVIGILALFCYATALVGDLGRGFAPALHRHASAFSAVGGVCLVALTWLRWRTDRAARQQKAARHL